MSEPTQGEVNIEQLMSEIRAAVAKREAEGRTSFLSASRDLYDLLSNQQAILPSDGSPFDLQSEGHSRERLQLQPSFTAKDHYHVNDLLPYHDETFIWNAYRALLKRDPDEAGLRQYLDNLRSGRFNKIDILAKIRFSIEGKNQNVRIDGLERQASLRRLYRVPVFGYLLELLVGIARFPSWIRSQRQFETHVLAQQDRLANHINQLETTVSHFGKLMEEQRKVATLQNRQMMALYGKQGQVDAGSEQRVGQQSTSNGSRFDDMVAAYIDHFRGSREQIKKGLEFYLSFVPSSDFAGGLLDLGCGRGEWLELLKDFDREAIGVESNAELANQAKGRGLQVVRGDALNYLQSVPDDSLALVTGFHFIEHLPFDSLLELLDEIKRTLKPGGVLIFETPNPKNLTVAACNFYADPTHRQPVFPETVEFVLKQRDFQNVRLAYLNPVEGSPFRNGREGSQELDSWFFGPRDFAIIASKSNGGESLLSEQQSAGTTLPVVTKDGTLEIHLAQLVSRSGHEYYARPQSNDTTIFEDVVNRNEYSLPPSFSERDVIIDIGSHIGSFSYAVLIRGAGKVYTYEAHPANHAITSKNLERFGDRAICRNLAVWRSDVGSQTLFNDALDSLSDGNTGGHAVVYNDAGLPVQSVGLDDIIFEATDGLSRKVRLLKIDCEGAEYPILFTATHLDYVEEICGEYHVVPPEMMPARAKVEGMAEVFDGNAIKGFLNAAGWSVQIEPTGEEDQLGHFRATKTASAYRRR